MTTPRDPEKMRQYRRTWKANHPEHKARKAELQRLRTANRTPEQREEERAKRRKYDAKDPERRRITGRRSYEKNKELWILGNIRTRARNESLPFNLTVDDIRPPEFCPVLGIKLERNTKGSKGGPQHCSPAVDRIIPSLGYVKGNIIVVSHLANCIKQNATPDQIRKVADFYERLLIRRLDDGPGISVNVFGPQCLP